MCRLLYLITASVTLLTACSPAIQGTAHGGIDYPYGPASFTIHLLSRFDHGTGTQGSGAVVCVEFDDIDQQPTRATGSLEIEISPPGQAKLEKVFDLSDLKTNSNTWNRSTRMYQVSFQFDPILSVAPEGGVPVKVTWTPVGGNPITVRELLRELGHR